MGPRSSRILPRPRPSRHPLWRKMYLWLISLAGTGLCIALLAAGLAPSPGHHQQPAAAVVGALGILCSAWIGVYAYRIPSGAVSDAMKRMEARRKARRLLEKNPVLAGELGIGRPDLPQTFDDGGLVDVNHVPVWCLAKLPGIDDQVAARIVEAREDIGGFSSPADLEVTLNLPPGKLDEVRERLLFRPIH